MKRTLYISDLYPTHISPLTDQILFLTPNTQSSTGYMTYVGSAPTVSSCSYSSTCSYANTSGQDLNKLFNQTLFTGDDVIFSSVIINGKLTVGNEYTNSYSFPISSGSNNSILSTDGAGNLMWDNIEQTFYDTLILSQSTSNGYYNKFLSSSMDFYIPNNTIQYYSINVFGVESTSKISVWNLDYSIRNVNLTSSFINDIKDKDGIYHTLTTQSCEIYKPSILSDNTLNSSVKLSIVQPNVLTISVRNQNELLLGYSTDWKIYIECKTFNIS